MRRIFRPVHHAPDLLPAPVLLLLCLCLGTLPARAETPAQAFRVGPPAAWVEPLPVPTDSGPSLSGGEETSISVLLLEEQVRVSGNSLAQYRHSAQKVLSSDGIDKVSDIQIRFDPTYEQLTVHGIWRLRDGRREDVFKPAEARVIQQEAELQQRLYNGTLSVVPFLHDVRVGDTVEVAYTVEGANPVFGGRFSDVVSIGFSVPVVHWSYRLLWPEGRPLFARDFGRPGLTHSERKHDGVEEFTWERRHVPAIQAEDDVPGWEPVFSWLQLTEYKDWNDVARWASALFQVPERSKALEQEIRRFSQEPTQEARFFAALRFVQDEVRYLGIELGPNSHQPHPPDEVLQRRFGDCKDKSLLLVVLLRGLGIDAQPALVNTRHARLLDGWRPTATAFDHAIVHATVAGRELWVDPTATLERGGLDSYAPPPYARALIVSPDTQGLATIPAPTLEAPSTFVDETFVAPDRDGPVTLDVVTTRTGDAANAMRRMLARTSRSDLSRYLLNFYASSDAKIAVAQPLAVEDDPAKNVLIVRERYRIQNFWSASGRRDFDAHLVREYLGKPTISQRTFPLAVEHPVFVRHRITLQSGTSLAVSSDRGRVEGPAFHLEADTSSDGKTLVLDYRYRSVADAVPPDRIPEHVKALRESEEERGFHVQLGRREARFTAPPGSTTEGGLILIAALVFCGLLAYVIDEGGPLVFWRNARAKTRRRDFARKFDPVHEGDSPEAAIPITGPQERLSTLGQLRCACGASGQAPQESLREEQIVLGERQLTLVQWQCPTCARARRVYFEDKGSRAA